MDVPHLGADQFGVGGLPQVFPNGGVLRPGDVGGGEVGFGEDAEEGGVVPALGGLGHQVADDHHGVRPGVRGHLDELLQSLQVPHGVRRGQDVAHRPPHKAPPLLHLHLDLLGLGLLGPGDQKVEHPVAEAGLHPGEVVGGRDIEAPGEGAVGALEAVVGHALLLLKGPFGLHREDPFLGHDLHLLGIHPGQVDEEVKPLAVLHHVHQGGVHPGPLLGRAQRPGQPLLQLLQLPERIKPDHPATSFHHLKSAAMPPRSRSLLSASLRTNSSLAAYPAASSGRTTAKGFFSGFWQ